MKTQLGYSARISYDLITNSRTYYLPDDTGTIALERYLVYTAIIDTLGFSDDLSYHCNT